ncbi:MAG: retropepsin-like aspartic protease family protein [Gammaproteobacteria bacterium]
MNQPRKIGFSMYILAAALLLGLLTVLFSGLLSHRLNPNKNPDSHTGANGQVQIVLHRNSGGHYVASGLVNDKKVVFLLDTGATAVAIPQELAQKLALTPGRQISTLTANGMTAAYTTTISTIQIGDIVEHNVAAVLVPNLPGGQILLGMSFLKRLDFSQRGDTLILETN